MPEFHNDSLVPQKHGVLSPFAIFTWCLVIVIALGVITLSLTKFDLERLRGSSYFIEKAHQAIEKKDWVAAISALQRVQGRERDEPPFLRVVADFLEATQSEPSVLETVLNKLDALGQMQPMDYIWACRLQLNARKIDLARKALDRIPTSERSSVDVLKLSVAVLAGEGRASEATAEEARLFQLFPNDPEVVLRTAKRDLKGTFAEIQQAALNKLWMLARQPNEWGLEAIRVLSEQSDLTLSEARQLLNLTDQQPAIIPAERLRVVSILLKLESSRREELINAEVKRYQQGTKLEKAQLGYWMASHHEYDKVMALVPEEELMKSAELFPMVAQGLAGQQRWKELQALISKDKRLPVSNALAETWRALVARNLKPDDYREPRAHLELALREAKTNKEHFVLSLVAQMSYEANMPDLALQAYQALADARYGQELEMLEKGWEMALLLKESEDLLKIAERLAELRPDNHLFVWRRDYLRLLRGEQVEITLQDSTTDSPENEKSGVLHLMRALKAYRMHDMTQVSKNLAKIQTLENFSSGESAVCAGLLAANGEQTRAYEVAEKIRPQVLLQEEELLWKKAL
ncbi:MAG: hypothetical protein JWR15_1223 [Prosthecobacter sp.]|nr:hypothetical protein [Prosthecobacter sp.]